MAIASAPAAIDLDNVFNMLKITTKIFVAKHVLVNPTEPPRKYTDIEAIRWAFSDNYDAPFTQIANIILEFMNYGAQEGIETYRQTIAHLSNIDIDIFENFNLLLLCANLFPIDPTVIGMAGAQIFTRPLLTSLRYINSKFPIPYEAVNLNNVDTEDLQGLMVDAFCMYIYTGSWFLSSVETFPNMPQTLYKFINTVTRKKWPNNTFPIYRQVLLNTANRNPIPTFEPKDIFMSNLRNIYDPTRNIIPDHLVQSQTLPHTWNINPFTRSNGEECIQFTFNSHVFRNMDNTRQLEESQIFRAQYETGIADNMDDMRELLTGIATAAEDNNPIRLVSTQLVFSTSLRSNAFWNQGGICLIIKLDQDTNFRYISDISEYESEKEAILINNLSHFTMDWGIIADVHFDTPFNTRTYENHLIFHLTERPTPLTETDVNVALFGGKNIIKSKNRYTRKASRKRSILRRKRNRNSKRHRNIKKDRMSKKDRISKRHRNIKKDRMSKRTRKRN